jgi:hypothetical protein
MKVIRVLKLLAPILIVSVILYACSKDSDKPEEEQPNSNPTTTFKFTWSLGNNASVTADDAYFVPAYSNIYATKGTTKNVNILLEDLSVGSHSITPSKGVTLDYTDGAVTYNAKSGTVMITKNNGSLVSGSYNCSVSNGSVNTTISGDFTDLPKK